MQLVFRTDQDDWYEIRTVAVSIDASRCIVASPFALDLT